MKNKFYKNKENGLARRSTTEGFTLVETLVAISIFTMSILGLMSVLASGIANTTYTKNKIISEYLAQEGIEYVRNMRDTAVLYDGAGAQHGWDSFKTTLSPCVSGTGCAIIKPTPFSVSVCSSPCKLYLNNGGYDTTPSATDSGFIRKVWVSVVNANDEKIYSEVDWTRGSTTYSTVFSEDLFNWVE